MVQETVGFKELESILKARIEAAGRRTLQEAS